MQCLTGDVMLARLALAAILAAISSVAWAQDCSGPQAAQLRQVLIRCPRDPAHPVAIGNGLSVPAACQVATSVPACPAGFANPIPTDLTGQWNGTPLSLRLDFDADGALQGNLTSPRGVIPLRDIAFDALSRTLSFEFEGAGGKVATHAALQLSDDESRLDGRWQWATGQVGKWWFTRAPVAAQPSPASPSPPPPPPPAPGTYAAAPPPSPVCHQPGWSHISPLNNQTLDETQTSIAGGACTISVQTPESPRYLQIASQPAHGVLTQTGTLSVVYRPAPGFRGVDAYVIRYCGSDATRSGCATFNYTVQVQ